VVALGFVAYGLASIAGSVHSLVAESSALGSAGIVVAGLLGMFSRFGGARAAWFALLTGALAYVYAEHVLESEIAYLLSLAGALSGYAIGAVTEPRPIELLMPTGQRIASSELPSDRVRDRLDSID
jgi:Na+/proline symporter